MDELDRIRKMLAVPEGESVADEVEGHLREHDRLSEEFARLAGDNEMLRDVIQKLIKMKGYAITEPEDGWRKREDFTAEEKAKLRPVAETLAMLDGNAFFTDNGMGYEHYECYLPEADATYQANGGDKGWAGQASFAKGLK